MTPQITALEESDFRVKDVVNTNRPLHIAGLIAIDIYGNTSV